MSAGDGDARVPIYGVQEPSTDLQESDLGEGEGEGKDKGRMGSEEVRMGGGKGRASVRCVREFIFLHLRAPHRCLWRR